MGRNETPLCLPVLKRDKRQLWAETKHLCAYLCWRGTKDSYGQKRNTSVPTCVEEGQKTVMGRNETPLCLPVLKRDKRQLWAETKHLCAYLCWRGTKDSYGQKRNTSVPTCVEEGQKTVMGRNETPLCLPVLKRDKRQLWAETKHLCAYLCWRGTKDSYGQKRNTSVPTCVEEGQKQSLWLVLLARSVTNPTGTFNPVQIFPTGIFNPVQIFPTGTFNPIQTFPTGTFSPIKLFPTGTFNPIQIFPTGPFNPIQIFPSGTFNPIQIFPSGTFNPIQIFPTGTFNLIQIFPTGSFNSGIPYRNIQFNSNIPYNHIQFHSYIPYRTFNSVQVFSLESFNSNICCSLQRKILPWH